MDRRPLIDRFRRVRAATEAIAAPLSAEDQTSQSMPDASPVKWHRAHTTWFFEEFVCRPHRSGYRALDDRHRFLFNSYYDAVGDRHPRAERGLQTRPGVHEVGAYRAHVDAAVLDLLEHADAATLATITPLVVLGLHHEQQHQELALMDVLHLFSRNEAWDPSLRARSAAASAPSVDAVAAGWIDVDGGVVEIGHRPTPVDADPFCAFAFDNEGPAHRVLLDDFRLATRPVTCGEMAAFVADDGYRRPELWLSDGWAAVCSRGWDAPLYWERDGDGWTTRTLDGRVAVDLDAPIVHVSHYEADAYARWAGARLPTEHEWEHAARDLPMAGNLLVDVATDALRPAAVTGPVTASPSAMFGDVWEWTASAYLPYPRFSPAPGAVGEYNGKFMSGQMVLRGGSFATPVDHVRSTYRNFFPPHARWVFAGLRLAMDA